MRKIIFVVTTVEACKRPHHTTAALSPFALIMSIKEPDEGKWFALRVRVIQQVEMVKLT